MGRATALTLATLVVIAPACGERAQLRIVVDTDLALGHEADADPTIAPAASINRIDIEVAGPSGQFFPNGGERDLVITKDTAWPLSFGIAEGDGGEKNVRLAIYGWRAGTERVRPNGTRGPTAALSVAHYAVLRVPDSGKDTIRIVLRGSCLGIASDLDATQTCVDGQLRDAHDPAPHTSDIPPSEKGSWAGMRVAPCGGAAPNGAICVPGGLFVRGDTEFEDVDVQAGLVSAAPRHLVTLNAFYMDRTEMTVGRLRALAARPSFQGLPMPKPRSAADPACTWEDKAADTESLPVVCIDPRTARNACRELGGDLPTDAQWERAARGVAGVGPYPWGTPAVRCCAARIAEDFGCATGQGATAVGSFADPSKCDGIADVTREGIVDLAGNAREMVQDSALPYGDAACPLTNVTSSPKCEVASKQTGARGGSFRSTFDTAKIGARTKTFVSDDLGFRCVYPGGP